ncbi:MAG: hypothetical protein M3Z66_06830 [Chloroflexota bacterium]|nr:hypothetical protein [Chloroflexota bacterium]
MNLQQRSRRLFRAFCAVTCLPAAAVVGILAGIFDSPLLGVGAVVGFAYGLLVMAVYLHYLRRFHPRFVEQAQMEELRAKGYTVHEPSAGARDGSGS